MGTAWWLDMVYNTQWIEVWGVDAFVRRTPKREMLCKRREWERPEASGSHARRDLQSVGGAGGARMTAGLSPPQVLSVWAELCLWRNLERGGFPVVL